MKTRIVALAASVSVGLTISAHAADTNPQTTPLPAESTEVQRELQTSFFTQLASTDGKCFVDRIRQEWEAAGKPEVKGWHDDVTDEEAEAAYQCIKAKAGATFAGSDEEGAAVYQSWKRYNTGAYLSATHGGRFVNNYANETGAAYGKFEESGSMTVGSVLAKDSFGVNKRGEVKLGPLFTMVKKEAGFNERSRDWQYVLILPNGKTMGATGQESGKKVDFCIACHESVNELDQMFFLPDEYRVQ